MTCREVEVLYLEADQITPRASGFPEARVLSRKKDSGLVVRSRDDTFLMLFNAHREKESFVPPGQEQIRWELIIDTCLEEGFLETPKLFASSEEYEMGDRSFSLLRLRVGEQSHASPHRGVSKNKTWQIHG